MLSLAPNAAAHPDPGPDHGVDNETFAVLWAGDVDIDDTAVFKNRSRGQPELVALALTTDIPVDEPPEAVERWNRADLETMPSTDDSESVYPEGAPRKDGRYLRDVTVSIFAVQPSTRARTSPDGTPLLVPPEGAALGATDYRVVVPPDDNWGRERERWTLLDSRLVETRLRVDGRVVDRSRGDRTPTLAYHGLDGRGFREYTLTLETEARARLAVERRRQVRVCRTVVNETANGTGNETEVCEFEWRSSRKTVTDRVVVRDSIQVRPHDFAVAGLRTRYPDGDVGVALRNEGLWLGYRTPAGDVNGVWRFYVARDPAWDTLVRSSRAGRTRLHSPAHPLQVHAYPFEPGATTDGPGIELLDTDGVRLLAPTLPETVLLDAQNGTYDASFEVVTRLDGADTERWPRVSASGLVRGVVVAPEEVEYTVVPLRESDLTLSILEATDETTTVRVTLRAVGTGEPIDTTERFEYVLLDGERVSTGPDGTVTVTIDRPAGAVTARYVPREWWRVEEAYLPDSETVYVHGTVLGTFAILFTAIVPVGLFLLAVFIIDRITGWGVWPPWRGL